jgi:hypothetical protein
VRSGVGWAVNGSWEHIKRTVTNTSDVMDLDESDTRAHFGVRRLLAASLDISWSKRSLNRVY